MLLLLYFIVFVSNNKFTREPPQKLPQISWVGFEWEIQNVIRGGALTQDGESECRNSNENVNGRFGCDNDASWQLL